MNCNIPTIHPNGYEKGFYEKQGLRGGWPFLTGEVERGPLSAAAAILTSDVIPSPLIHATKQESYGA